MPKIVDFETYKQERMAEILESAEERMAEETANAVIERLTTLASEIAYILKGIGQTKFIINTEDGTFLIGDEDDDE